MARVLTFVAAVTVVGGAAVRVSCVGDSITAGVCSSKTHGYPAVLQTLLGDGYTVTNYGNSGKTMLRYGLCGASGGDCAYENQTTYPAALASTPDIVTIMLGTNDAKCPFNWITQQALGDSYEADYLAMIAAFLALPSKPKVFVMVPPPLYPPNPYAMNKTVINEVFPILMRKIASESGAQTQVIDVFNALGGAGLTQPNITCDGCHPVDAGYIEIAQLIAKTLTGQTHVYSEEVYGPIHPLPPHSNSNKEKSRKVGKN